MKFLIVAAVIACAYAAPSAVLPLAYNAPLVAPYAPVAPLAPLAPVAPTISSGDVQAAAIDASVKATDVAQHVFDQTNEAHGEAIAAAEEKTWEAVDAVKTAEAEIDGAAAAASPTYAKAYAAPVVAPIAPLAPVAPIAPLALRSPVAYSALGYNAYPYGYNAYNAYTAPLVRAW